MGWLETIVDRRAWLKSLAPLCASLAMLLGAIAETKAQSAGKVSGTVESLTTAPRGEIDGAVLDDGTVLHWPPHLEDQFKNLVAVGDRVEATGNAETGKRGETRFEIARLTNLRTKATAVNDDRRPPRGPKGPKGRGPRRGPDGLEDRDVTTARGVVRSLTTAPRGEIDGAMLDDGTALHWPPHLEDQFKDIAAVGDRVEATGSTETGKRGEVRFEVLRLTNLQTKASADNDRGRLGPPRGRPADRDEQLRALEEQIRHLQREIDRLRRER